MFKLVVLSCLVAAAAASAVLPFAPVAYSAPVAFSTPLGYAAPVLTAYENNFRGPLSLAPGQPANILAADGRPLDTLDVNLDRSAHFTAKNLESAASFRSLKKRSAPLITPVSHVAVAAPLVPSFSTLAYPAPAFGSRLAVAPVISSRQSLAPVSISTVPVTQF